MDTVGGQGVTSNIARRAWEYRSGLGGAFAQRYNQQRLVFVEPWDEMIRAIQREKDLKHWLRQWTIEMIEKTNPEWDDLYDKLA